MKCWVVGCHREAIYGENRCIEHKLPSYEDRPAKGTPYENTAMDLPGFGMAEPGTLEYELETEEAAHDDIQRSISDNLDTQAPNDVDFGGGESGGGGSSGDF